MKDTVYPSHRLCSAAQWRPGAASFLLTDTPENGELTSKPPRSVVCYKVSPPRFSCLPPSLQQTIRQRITACSIPGHHPGWMNTDRTLPGLCFPPAMDTGECAADPGSMPPLSDAPSGNDSLEAGTANLESEQAPNNRETVSEQEIPRHWQAELIDYMAELKDAWEQDWQNRLSGLTVSWQDLVENKLSDQRNKLLELLNQAQAQFEEKYALHPLCYTRDHDLQARLTGLELRIVESSAALSEQTETAASQLLDLLDLYKQQVEERLTALEEGLRKAYAFIQEQEQERQKARERLYVRLD